MRSRWLIAVSFALLTVHAALAQCTNGANVSDGVHGNVLTTFGCVFVPSGPNATTVFNLTNFITDGGTLTSYEYENWLVPGYIVFTTDPGDLTMTTDWVDVLYFVPDQASGTGSDTVDLYTGSMMPSYTTVNNFGAVSEIAGGAYIETAGADVHSFAIGSSTPEPSTFLMMLSAGLGLLALRRRLA